QADERLRAGLDGYWTAVGGFPEEAQGGATWIGARLAALVRFPFAPLAEALPPAVAVAALALGVAALARARSGDARLLVGPPAAGIAVALAGIYPMGARLTLFYA